MAKGKTRSNDKPSRQKYWATGKLEDHKVKNLVEHCGLSLGQATELWRTSRKRRVKTGKATVSILPGGKKK